MGRLRFVWAVAAFVLAAVLIGAGIAQRTVFHGPDTQTAQLAVDADAPYTVIDGAVLTSLPGTQSLRVEGEGTVFVAYGRSSDVRAWLADVEYNDVTLGEEGAIVSSVVVPPEPEDAADAADEESGDASDESADAEPVVHDPVGSDLWLEEYQQDDVVTTPLQLPAEMSVIVASDGTDPAPATISISWPIDDATPWAGPLFVLGGLFLAAGLVLYALGIRHARRSRGPRRKAPPPLPPTEPIDIAVEGGDAGSRGGGSRKGVISASPRRRPLGRRSLVAVPVVLVAGLAVTGCSPDVWPQLSTTPTPSPTATVLDAADQQSPAVTAAQAQRILERISETVAQADADLDAELAATRLDDAVLDARTTNYRLREGIDDYAPSAPIPTEPLSIVLPQAYDGWPRSVMMIVGDESDSDPAPVMMMMSQQDPWSEYKVDYLATIEAATQMPDLAPTYVGAAAVQPDSAFLVLPPEELAGAYADVINNGDDSEYAILFDEESDQLRQAIASDRQSRLDQFNETGAETGELSFDSAASDEPIMALATLESGAIVAVTVDEIETVRPTNEDAVIRLDNTPTVQTLTELDESASGFTTTYEDQLFFYVPGQGSNERIRLLGYTSNIENAEEIE